MSRRARRIVFALCVLAALSLVSAASDDPVDEVNLFIAEVAMLPTEPIESGDVFRLDVSVALEGQGSLETDPYLEIALRRQDKPEACVTELAAVPRVELQERGAHTLSFAIDTLGLSGGRYEVVAEIQWDGVESNTVDNRVPLGFVIIADPRPELHPVELRTDPAVPLQWGETGTIHATVANTGRLGTGAFHLVFELRPIISPGEAEGSFDAECAWIEIGSRFVPGLARNKEVHITTALDVAALLESGLAESASPCPLPGIADLREGGMEFDLRACIVYPAPDTERAVDELDPTNNEIITRWKVVPSSLGRPDLVPLSVTFDEDLPLNWDDAMAATVTVANIGGRATDAGFAVRFSFRRLGDTAWNRIGSDGNGDGVADDRRLRYPLPIEVGANEAGIGVTIDPLSVEPGGATLRPGSYELRVEIDAGDEVLERNEANNTLIVGFSVRGTELQAEGIELPSTVIRQGSSLIVRAWIVNTGDRPAKEFAVGFYLNDDRFDTFVYADAEGLREDERTQVQGVLDTRDLPPASYDLRVIVDPDNQIPEYDEGNNAATMPIQLHPPAERLAELQVTAVRLEPSSPIGRGSDVLCAVSVRNVGEIDAESFRVRLEASQWQNDQLGWTPYAPALDVSGMAASLRVSSLERGEAALVRIPFSAAGFEVGSYRLRASVDAEQEVAEIDESNNATTVLFSIGEPIATSPDPYSPLPNLTCTGVAVAPSAQVEVGTLLTVTGWVANAGGAPSPSSEVTLYWLDPLGNTFRLSSAPVAALSIGQQMRYSFLVDTTDFILGSQGLFVVVDPQRTIDERSEEDNACRATVQIGVSAEGFLPDLVPISVRFDSPGATVGENTAVEPNQPLYAYVTVRNIGNVPSGPFNVAFETSLGVRIESWTGVGPLDQVEVSHPVPTGTSGTFSLSIEVDPDAIVQEDNESNNSIPNAYIAALPSYVVLPPDVVKPQLVAPALVSAGSARWLQADEASGLVYVVSDRGTVRAIGSRSDDPAGNVEVIAAFGAAVADVVWSLGAMSYAYIGTSEGENSAVRCVDLGSRATVAEVTLGSPVVALAGGGATGQLFAAVEDGIHRLTLAGSVLVASPMIEVPGAVLDVLYDVERATVYVLSTTGAHAYDQDLQKLCTLDAAELVGTPSVLSLAGSGIYVGTDAGTGAVVYAASHCMLMGDTEGRILVGWRYPRMGTLPSRVSSIVIDPRDIDPIYVATEAGTLYAFGFDGNPLWTYEAGSAIASTPLADKRSGRIFFGDDGGVPHVLTLDGVPAFEIDLSGYSGGEIRSTLAIVETREKTDLGTRFVRNYYYGTQDGAVYRIASQQ